jgi:predicted permease
MSNTPRWRQYLRFARPNVPADVDEELGFHLEMRIAEYMRQGMSRADAEREAQARFGAVSPVRQALVDHDRSRQTRVERREHFSDLMQDVRFGVRSLKRAPGFAIASIVTLAIGIGANTAIFSVVNALLLRPLPYPRSEELVRLGGASGGEFLALRDRLKSFSDLAAYVDLELSIDDGKEAVRLEGSAITTNLLHTLGVSPALGAGFPDEASVPGKNHFILLSDGAWRARFGADRSIVGRTVLVDGIPTVIAGVMPREFRYPSSAKQFWVPIAFNPANVGAHWAVQNDIVIGRVRRDTPIVQATKEVRDVWPTLRRLNPLWDPGPLYRRDANPRPLQEAMVGAPKSLLWTLLGCVFLVLLIACVNVANLLLARATARDRELAVRAAVGGGRGRLVRQLVTESLLLSVAGAGLGTALAIGAVRWLVAILPPGIPRVDEIVVDGTVLAVTGALALGTGLVFGILPALRATRAASATHTIGSRRSTHGVGHHRLSALLVAGEVALAVMLVIAAQLLVRSFGHLRSVQTGFEETSLIAARITPPNAVYREPDRLRALYTSAMGRIGGIPGVKQVAAVDKLPFATAVWGIAPRIEGQWEDGTKPLPDVDHFQMITPDYFSAMRIPVIEGRAFSAADGAVATPVAIVSKSMARRFWPNQSAVGKRIGYAWPSPWITIVGVVADVRQDSLRDTLTTSIYVPWEQRSRMSGSEMWLLARTTGDPKALAGSIRAIVHDLDRTVPVSDVRTMEDIVDGSVQRDRFMMLIVGLFAGVALLLGAVGIYGVMSYLVSQRTQEMGVRIALGASAPSVVKLIVSRGLGMAVAGALAGMLIAIWATRPLAALLYGVSATDPVTFGTVPLIFVLVAIAASAFPALRATRVDPVRTLRAD